MALCVYTFADNLFFNATECYCAVSNEIISSSAKSTISDTLVDITQVIKEKKLCEERKQKEAQEKLEQEQKLQAERDRQKQKESEYFISDIPLDKSLQEYTYDLCCQNDMSYDLALALMYCESKFDTDAIYYNDNGSYDSGIMQINSCNIDYLNRLYGISDLTDPYENIYAGINIISQNIDAFGENDALMVYNMGLGGYYSAVNNGIYQTKYSCDVLSKKEEIETMPRG